MFFLAPGVTFSLHGRSHMLRDFAGQREKEIQAPDVPAVEALCLGTAGLDDLGRGLHEEGWVVEAEGYHDEVLLQRLVELDDMYGWWRRYMSERHQQAYKLAQLAHARRKRFLWAVGQCPTLPETTMRRALIVPDDKPQKILCIGDDDLVSVPLAALGHEVVVFDIDDYLLALLERFAKEHGLNIKPMHMDLREALDPQFREQFDYFFTDPMSNYPCLQLFSSRGIECLKVGGRGNVAIFHPAESVFNRISQEFGFKVTEYRRDFNQYYWASFRMAYYVSDEYSFEKTADTTVSHPLDQEFFEEDILYDYVVPKESVYTVDFYDVDVAAATEWHVKTLFELLQDEGVLELAKEGIVDSPAHLTYCGVLAKGGFVNLYIDKQKRFMKLTMMPFDPEKERTVRAYLMNGYKSGPTKVRIKRTMEFLEVQVY